MGSRRHRSTFIGWLQALCRVYEMALPVKICRYGVAAQESEGDVI